MVHKFKKQWQNKTALEQPKKHKNKNKSIYNTNYNEITEEINKLIHND